VKYVRIIETIFGILFFPFIWIYERLIEGKPPSPPEFWLFIGELRKRGVIGQLQMQELHIEELSSSAIVILDLNPSKSEVVSLFKCDSVEAANRKLAELESNPLMSHSKQRDCYLMSVTFLEPNDQLAAKVVEAFGAFELPPNTSLNQNVQKRRIS